MKLCKKSKVLKSKHLLSLIKTSVSLWCNAFFATDTECCFNLLNNNSNYQKEMSKKVFKLQNQMCLTLRAYLIHVNRTLFSVYQQNKTLHSQSNVTHDYMEIMALFIRPLVHAWILGQRHETMTTVERKIYQRPWKWDPSLNRVKGKLYSSLMCLGLPDSTQCSGGHGWSFTHT